MSRIMICGHCGRGAPFEGPYQGGRAQCRLCWNYANNAAFKKLIDEEPKGDPRPVRPEMPSYYQKYKNWSEDTRIWEAAGRPTVNQEVADQRKAVCLSNICNAYDASRDTCLACGCPLHATLFGDKLKRATSECPRGFWKATVPAPESS